MGTTPQGDAAEDAFALYRAAPPFARAEVLARPCPVPAAPGVYGWWFRELPAAIDTMGCATRDGLTLLYVGISPSAPPANGKLPSRQNIRARILIQSLDLPLNLQGNSGNNFYSTLKAVRHAAAARANQLAALPNPG